MKVRHRIKNTNLPSNGVLLPAVAAHSKIIRWRWQRKSNREEARVEKRNSEINENTLLSLAVNLLIQTAQVMHYSPHIISFPHRVFTKYGSSVPVTGVGRTDTFVRRAG